MSKRLPILLLFLSLGFSSAALAQPGDDYPTYDPSRELYMGLTAQLLAEDIKHLYGGEHWNDSLLISFDYVAYTRDTVETVRYHQEWNRLTDEALLSGTLDDGRRFAVRFSDLSNREGVMYVDSVPIAEAFQKPALNTAYNQLMYHMHWMLLPVQLVDSGVVLERLKDTSVGGKRVATLRATIAGDSGSPNTTFLIYVNPTYKNIERWRVSHNGSEQEYIWRLYQRVEPFLISTKRYTEDFKTYIQFENIRIEVLDKDRITQLEEGRRSERPEQSVR